MFFSKDVRLDDSSCIAFALAALGADLGAIKILALEPFVSLAEFLGVADKSLSREDSLETLAGKGLRDT